MTQLVFIPYSINMENYFKLTEEEILLIRERISKRVYGTNAFTYYLNNCVSCHWCPKRLASAVCDVVYWVDDKTKPLVKMDLDIVGYMVNECFYNVKYDEVEKTYDSIIKDIIEAITPKEAQELFYDRIKNRFLDSDIK